MQYSTRALTLEKSAPLFNKKRYAATSVSDILKVTGPGRGGIYCNFRRKDEIAIAVLEYSFKQVMNAMNERVIEQGTHTGQLHAVLDCYNNYSATPVIEVGCPILNTAIDADDSKPFLKAEAWKGLTKLVAYVQLIVERGMSNDECRATPDAYNEASLMVATVEGGKMMSKLTGNPDILNSLQGNLRNRCSDLYIQ